MGRSKLLSSLVAASIGLTFAMNASATVYSYTFGTEINAAGDVSVPSPGNFATLLFNDVANTFTLSFLSDSAFAGASVRGLEVNYNNGISGAPTPVAASSISGGVSVVSANNSDVNYPSDSFTWAIGNGSNHLTAGESVSWTASTLNKSWLQGAPLGTFALNVFNNPVGNHNTVDSWYQATAVTAVPEPETYGMMLVGLGLMGFIARRRKGEQA